MKPERAKEIFSAADRNNSMSLGHREFRRAMKGIQKELSKSALARLGLSRRTLVLAVAGAGFVLLLVLVFIFLGISSLTTGSAFGAVINAVLPMTAGEGVR